MQARCPAYLLRDEKGPCATGSVLGRSFRVGSRPQRAGEISCSLTYVKLGLLEVRQTLAEGGDRAIAVIGPGNLLGQSGIHGQPSIFSIRALTPVSVCEFASDAPLSSLAQRAACAAVLGMHTRMVVRTLAEWGAVARIASLSQRFAQALRLLAEMQPAGQTQLPSQLALAELLGVTRESINREWKAFEARGALRRRHRQTVELDLEALAGLAETRP